MSKLLGASLLASMGKRKEEENEMLKKANEFLEKKMEIVELFLAEKTQCIPLSELPERCMKIQHPDKEVYLVDNQEILAVSMPTKNNKIAFKFIAIDFSEFDYNLLQEIIKEVMSDG